MANAADSARAPHTSLALPLLGAIATEPWRALAGRAAEPNAYYLPDWADAVARLDAGRGAISALAAFADDRRRMIGLLPVTSCRRVYHLPLPVLVSADPFRSLDTPLLDGAAPEQAAAALIGRARETGARALVLRLLPLEGAAFKAFAGALATRAMRPLIINSATRALLDAHGDGNETLRAALGARKLRELRRQRNRLAERHGAVTFHVACTPPDVASAFDMFLRLEASGWKGRRGTALASQPTTARHLRDAAVALASRRACEVAVLRAGSTPVAAGIVLRHQDRAFFFKIGIDETFARFSPGVQLTLDLTRHLCADPVITSADSTAAPNHPMIDPIWRGRLAIGDVLIPLRPRDPLMPLIHAMLRGHGLARRTALRLLRRA